MKKVFILVLALVIASQANVFFLVTCQLEYNQDLYKSVYKGVYRSPSGNYYTYLFDHYCPQTIHP